MTSLTAAERYSVGLSVLLHMGSLTTLSRETGLSLRQLQDLRDEFLAAAKKGLAADSEGTTAIPVEMALHELRLANDFAQLGEHAAAEAAFRRAIAIDPANGHYRKGLGLFLFGQGRRQESFAALEEALERLHRDSECECVLAMVQWIDGRANEVDLLLRRGLEAPGLPDYLLAPVVDLQLARGRGAEALALIERERQLREGVSLAHATYVHAMLLKRLGRWEDSVVLLEDTIGAERPEHTVELAILLATIECTVLQRKTAGLRRLREIVAGFPGALLPRLVLGEMLLATGELADAEQELLRVLYREPDSERAALAITDLYIAMGASEKLRRIGTELQREGQSCQGALLEAHGLVAEGRLDEAARVLAPSTPELRESIAVRVLQTHVAFETRDGNRLDSAIGELLALLARRSSLSTEEVQVLVFLIRFLRLNGEQIGALRLLDAMPRAGDQAVFDVERGLCLAEVGQTKQALAILQALVERQPHEGVHATRLAYHLLHHHADPARARDVLASARRLARPTDEFAVSLVAVHCALGAADDALDVVHEAFIARGRVPPATPELHGVLLGGHIVRGHNRTLAAEVVSAHGARHRSDAQRHATAALELCRTDQERTACQRLVRMAASLVGLDAPDAR